MMCHALVSWCPFLSNVFQAPLCVHQSYQPHLRLCGVNALQTSHLERSELSHLNILVHGGPHLFTYFLFIDCFKIL